MNKDATILIVDDGESNREILKDIVEDAGYKAITAEDGIEALEILQKTLPHLIISDIYMPKMDGIELCVQIKKNPETADIPVIFESSDGIDVLQEGFKKGGVDYIPKPFYAEIVKARIDLHLQLQAAQREQREANRMLQVSVREQLKQIENEKKNMLYALNNVIKANMRYDERHIDRVAYNCRMMAEALQLSNEYQGKISDTFIETIGIAAPVCDLGNVSISDAILYKSGKLTDDEMEAVKKHTEYGASIISEIMKVESNNDYLQMGYDIALSHHESFDGSGYPEGKCGGEIPVAAQIVSIVSAYCAMTEDRPYRKAFEPGEAISMIKDMAGIKYNPLLCDVIGMIVNQLR